MDELSAEQPSCHHYGIQTFHPEALQFYSANTPNGIKVACILEELVEVRSVEEDLKYEAHTISLVVNPPETRMGSFLKINPNGKIPALYDPKGADGPVTVFESGACLVYLAEKYDEFLPASGPLRYEVLKWLFWASTGVSSQFKLFGFFYKHCKHDIPYCVQRYAGEVRRLLSVLEGHLASQPTKHWIAGDLYSIADIATWPWIYALYQNYHPCCDPMEGIFKMDSEFPHVVRWYRRILARGAVKRSLEVTPIYVP